MARPTTGSPPPPLGQPPPSWGSTQAEAIVEVEQEFRAGDRVQFTRNTYRAERHNGDTAEVVAIDPTGSSVVVERDNGRRDLLDQPRTHLADFMAAYSFARRLKTLSGLTPQQHITTVWTSEPERFIVNATHQTPELNS